MVSPTIPVVAPNAQSTSAPLADPNAASNALSASAPLADPNAAPEAQLNSALLAQPGAAATPSPAPVYAPFGLAGLAPAFPLGGPDGEERLLTKDQASERLRQWGLPASDAKRVGLHYKSNGSAVWVQHENAYRVRELNATCVNDLKGKGKQIIQAFLQASQKTAQSQDIENLSTLSRASTNIRESGLVACSNGSTRRLELLSHACDEWAQARSTVARLMHQTKARKSKIEALKQQLATMQDVLAKDQDAVEEAKKKEETMAHKKHALVAALSAEISQDMRGLSALLDAKKYAQ